MFDASLIGVIAASVFILFIVFFVFRKKQKYPYSSQEKLLTKAELKFFHSLYAATKNKYTIAPKVRLADIINCSDQNWRKGYGPKISSKHIDFVLYDFETSKILLAIELDDKSHQLPQRQKRDIFVNNAMKASKVPLLRIPVQKGYDLAFLDKEIKTSLNA